MAGEPGSEEAAAGPLDKEPSLLLRPLGLRCWFLRSGCLCFLGLDGGNVFPGRDHRPRQDSGDGSTWAKAQKRSSSVRRLDAEAERPRPTLLRPGTSSARKVDVEPERPRSYCSAKAPSVGASLPLRLPVGPAFQRQTWAPARAAAAAASLAAPWQRRQSSGPAATTAEVAAIAAQQPTLNRQQSKLQALREARTAAARGQLLRAQGSAEELGRLSSKPGAAPDLEKLPAHIQRVRRLLASRGCEKGAGWRRFDIGFLTLWRRWDPKTGALCVTLRSEARGSLTKQIAALRDVELAEDLWDGAYWDMWSQHTGCVSLVRWLQKDPFTNRKTEVMMERVFCDCLDWDSCAPCWVVLERSPNIKGFATFSGMWGPFDIPAPPPGFIRSIATESGRIVEPLGPDRCLMTTVLELHLPSVIRAILTDSLLTWAVRVSAKNVRSSWERLMEGWDKTGFGDRMRSDRGFYAALEERAEQHLQQAARA